MKYNVEVFTGNIAIDEFVTEAINEDQFAIDYPEATQFVYTEVKEEPKQLNQFLQEKLNNLNPEYISSLSEDGSFFIEFYILEQKLLEKVFAIARVFGYWCSIGKASDKYNVKFNKR